MPKKAASDPRQTEMVFEPGVMAKAPSGEPVYRPGPVVQGRWLDAKTVAGEFGRDRASVYRWRAEGVIPERMVRPAGLKMLLFSAEVIPYLRELFQGRHD